MIDIALTAQVMVWVMAIVVLAWSRQASVFHPAVVYLLFHGLVFVWRPIMVQAFGFDSSWVYMGIKPTDEVFVKTLAISSVAMICLVGGCLLAGHCPAVFPSLEPPVFTPVQRRALLATTLLLLPLMAWSIYATRSGVAGERVNGIYTLTNSTGYLNEAQNFIMPLMVIWIVMTRFHWLNLALVLPYLGYRTWYGWSRWTILLFFLLSAMCYCWYYRRKWLPAWSVLLAIPVLFLFNLIGHNRDMVKQFLAGEPVRTVDVTAGMTTEDKFKARFDTQDFANFDFLTYVVYAVPAKTQTYSFWAQYAQLFTEPIPRILWKGKPAGSPLRSIDVFAYGNFTGLTVSLAGDGWISGGWLGVILELSLVGALLGLAHRTFWRHTGDVKVCLLYLASLAMVPQWYRDGGISIAKFLLFTVAPVLIWIGMTWFLGQRLVPGYSVRLPAGSRVRVVANSPGQKSRPQA